MKGERGLGVLLVTQTILVGGLALSFPFLAIYLHRDRGVAMGWVGAAISGMLLATSASQGLGGELSDLLGRKRVMVLAVWARALTVLVMAWAIHARWPLWALLPTHWVSSFLGHFYDPAARGWVADHYGTARRTEAYGKLRVAMNLGWAIGPAVGGALAERSYAGLFVATSAACAVCAMLVSWGLEGKAGTRHGESFAFGAVLKAGRDPRFLRFCLWGSLIAMVMSQLVASLSVHATRFMDLTERQVGLLFSLNGAMVVLIQGMVSRFWAGRPITAALAAGCLFYAAGYVWVGLATSMAGLALAVMVVSFGEITVSPGIHALAANLAPEGLKGRYIGFSGLTSQVGTAMGPLFGGLGLQYWSPAWSAGPWLAVSGAAIVASAGFRRFRRELAAGEEGLVVEAEARAAQPNYKSKEML